MFRHVQLARYISAPIALIYGILGPSNSSHFLQGRNGSFFTSNVRQLLEKLKDTLYPYKNASKFS